MAVTGRDLAEEVRERITLTYRSRTKTSELRFLEACRVLPGGITRSITHYEPYPQTLAYGDGCHIDDVDGNRSLDLLNNYTALVHGHNHPDIVASITSTASSGLVFNAPIELQHRLARTIVHRVRSVEKVRFTNSGTEAVMNALRLARAVTGRPKVLKMEGAFHGSYDGVALSVHPGREAPDWPAAVPDARGLAPYIREGVLVAPYNDEEKASEIVEAHKDELAGIIVEPMTWAPGAIPARREFLQTLASLAGRHGIVFILDEVVTSRLSPGGAQELFGLSPDLTIFGKVIGGGLPIGAFGGSSEMMKLLDPRAEGFLAQAGTFSGSPLSMAAGVASLELLDAGLIARLDRSGDRLRAELAGVFRSAGIDATITGMGSLGCIHFGAGPIRSYRDAIRAGSGVQRWLHLALRNRGVIIDSRGHFALSSPMTADDLEQFVAAVADALIEIRPLVPA